MVTTTWTQTAGMTGDTDTDNIENYAEQAEASKNAAAASETAAAASATAAAASEADAESAEVNASASETAAAASATSASSSATAASNSASSASTSATNANTSASNSATSAAASASSAAAASTSEANSASSAAAALVSENASAASETAASASASAASTSETNAAASETAAAASETAAQTAQAAAEAAEAATEALFDQFGDQYLGPKASDPTVDNDGNPLAEGAVYFNTTDDVLKFYSGSAWVAPESVATTAAAAAQAAQAAAETAETNAETAETNAAASASSASSSASAASTSASEAAASAASINPDNIDINGGTIDGTVIGGSTPAAGSFTTGSFTGNVAHGDNVKATFGAGSDLEIFHQTSNGNSIIREAGGGDLSIQTNGSGINFYDTTNAYSMAEFDTGGGVAFRHNGDLVFNTTSAGINVTGSITADEALTIVSASDYGRIEVGGPSGAYIDLKSPNSDDFDGRIVTFGGALYIGTPISSGNPVALQFEQNTKLATTTSGIDVTGTVASDGLTVDGDPIIQGPSGATLTLKNSSTNITTNDLLGQVDFYNNDFSGDGPSVQARISATTPNTIGNGAVLQFFTTNAGTGTEGSDPISRMQINHLGKISFYEDTGSQAKLTWDASDEALEFGDNVKATFGASADLRIYQNGSDSIIEDQGAGNLVIRGTDLYIRSSSNSNRIYSGTDTRLYYDGNEKIRTTSTGISVTGSVDFGDWTITESGGSLYFATGGTNKMKLDASGNLDVVGSVNSNATIT